MLYRILAEAPLRAAQRTASLLSSSLVRLQLLEQVLTPLVLLPALNAVVLLPEAVPDISGCGNDDHEVVNLLAAAEAEGLDFRTEVSAQPAVGRLIVSGGERGG